ncbi:LytR C-terminal domain-containing protein [Fusobacterium mortiferum]|uniref:LytR C-terminal domain-containing protein n=1 Tax=uncultured Fusobacterium sp. TaxID=159267 RepID=UPI00195A23BD|nr:LytR C-terminal domain-containing protein [uncultured Fusobacterium sp.]MBM6689768.1 LytR C-terminal domain-containing protein [Fusobacterium mortiferum]
MNRRVRAIFTVIFVIVVLGGFLFINSMRKNPELDKNSSYLIIGKENLIAVYQDKLAVRIPYGINIDKDKTFKDLVDNKNEEEILKTVNKLLPVPLNNYMRVKFGQVQLNVKNAKNIPETTVDNKRYIVTSSLHSMYETLYNEQKNKNELNENIIVDVLNANGINGYARRTGENIKNKLGMKYNAANYEKNLEESYIILNDISNEKAEEIVMQLNEKYFKIQQVPTIPTLANVVVILGQEKNIDFTIEVLGENSTTIQNISDELKREGYKKVEIEKDKVKADNAFVEYASEDYFIAYKIAKKLNISNFIENNNLKNKIRVITK